MNNTFSEEQQLPTLTNIKSPENNTCCDTDNNVGGIKDRKHTQFTVDEQAEPFSENVTTRINSNDMLTGNVCSDGGCKDIYGPYFGEYLIYNCPTKPKCNTCSPKKSKVVGKCGQPNCRGIPPEVNAEAVCGKPTCSDKPPASSPGLEACEEFPCAYNRKPGGNPICGQPQCVYKEPNQCYDWTCEKKPHPEPMSEPPPPPPKRRSQMEILLQVPSYRLVEKAEDLPFAAFDLLGTALTLPWRTQLEGEDSSESDIREGDLQYDVEPCFSSTSTSSKEDENMMSVTCNKCSNIIQLHSALLDNAVLNTGTRCPIRIEEVPGIGTTDAKLFRIVLGSKKDNNSKPEINCKNKNCRFKDPDILKITVTPSKLEETPKFCEGAEPICGRVEKTEDGEPNTEGEETEKGEPNAEGEETEKGDPNAEGEETEKGEPNAEGEETEKGEPVAEGEETAEAEPTAEGEEPAGEAVPETKGEVEEAAPGSEAQTEDPSGLKISTLKTCMKAELGDQCREANKVTIQIGEDLNLTLVTNVGIQREEIPEEPPLPEELCVCPNLVGGENEVPEDLPTVEIVITASDVIMANEQVRAPMKSVSWVDNSLVSDKVKKTDGCDCPGGKADSPPTGAAPCKCARQGDQVCGPVGDELKMCSCKCQKETKVFATPFLTVKKSPPKKSVSGVSIQTTKTQVQSTSCGCFGSSIEDLPSPAAQQMPPCPTAQPILPCPAAQPIAPRPTVQSRLPCPADQPIPPCPVAQPIPSCPEAKPMPSCLASQPTPTCPSAQPMAPPSPPAQLIPPSPAAQTMPPCPALHPMPPCPASQPLPPVQQETSGTASMESFSLFLILNTPQTDGCICSNSPASKDEESEEMMKTALICVHIDKDGPCACVSSTKATTEEPVVHISEYTDASTSCPTVCKPVTHSCAANILKSKESPSFHYKTNVGTLTRPMPPETIDKPDFFKMMAKATNKTANADLPANPCSCPPVKSPPSPSAANKTANTDLPINLCTCSPVVSPPKPSAPVIDPPRPPCPPPKLVATCSCTSVASVPSTPEDPPLIQEDKTTPKFIYAEMPKENLDLHTMDYIDLAKALDCFMGCQKGKKSEE